MGVALVQIWGLAKNIYSGSLGNRYRWLKKKDSDENS